MGMAFSCAPSRSIRARACWSPPASSRSRCAREGASKRSAPASAPSASAPTASSNSCASTTSMWATRPSSGAAWSRWRNELPRERQFEVHEAFELALGLPSGADVDFALALLAEIVRAQLGDLSIADRLSAALLDEGAKDRRLSLVGRKIGAIPAVAAVARAEEISQQIGFLALARRIARIADDANARQDAFVVESRRQDDGEIIDFGAGKFLDLGREIVGLGPIFQFVVVAEIDLAQSVRLRPAAPKILPAAERGRRRPAIRSAGIIREGIRQRIGRGAELQVPDFEPGWLLLGARGHAGGGNGAEQCGEQDRQSMAHHARRTQDHGGYSCTLPSGISAPESFAPSRLAPVRMARVRRESVRSAPARLAPVKSAPNRSASVSFAPLRLASRSAASTRPALSRLAPSRLARRNVASTRLVLLRSAPRNEASSRRAPVNTAAWIFAPSRLARTSRTFPILPPVRSAPEKSAALASDS